MRELYDSETSPRPAWSKRAVLWTGAAEALALNQAVQLILLWSDVAFQEASPMLATDDGALLLKPEIGAVVRAAYDPTIPPVSNDAALAYRLAARMRPDT